MTVNRCLKLSTLSAVLIGSAVAANALVVRHEHIDLADTNGQDRWRTVITFEDSAFQTGQGFSVLFDPLRHSALSNPSAGNADWDSIALQPDDLLPAYGAFDGLALASAPDLTGPFQIEYSWNGTGEPGPLAFVYYDQDFRTIESGETLPEPGRGALLLALLGMSWLGSRRRDDARGAER